MTLDGFIEKYHHEDVVILLEGKRDVKSIDKVLLKEIGSRLAKELPHAQFRSGNANGADELFAQGVCAIDSERFHVVISFPDHRKKSRENIKSYSLEDFSTLTDPLIAAVRKHNSTSHLVDPFLRGERNRVVNKVAFIMRNAIKVLGFGQIPPTTVALFYDDLENPEEGGTGFTIQTCRDHHIPLWKQDVWKSWL
jgi:hypothetical protein